MVYVQAVRSWTLHNDKQQNYTWQWRQYEASCEQMADSETPLLLYNKVPAIAACPWMPKLHVAYSDCSANTVAPRASWHLKPSDHAETVKAHDFQSVMFCCLQQDSCS